MMNEKYQRCPFDDGKCSIVQSEINQEWYARCRTCTCQKGGYTTKEAAVEGWEQRVSFQEDRHLDLPSQNGETIRVHFPPKDA